MLPDTDIEATRKKGPGSPNSMMSVVDVIHRKTDFAPAKNVQYSIINWKYMTCVSWIT